MTQLKVQLPVYTSVTDQAEVFVICLSLYLLALLFSVPVVSVNVLALRQPEMIKSHVDPWLWTALIIQTWVLCSLALIFKLRWLRLVSPLSVLVLILQFRDHTFVTGSHQIKPLGRWLGIHMHPGPTLSTRCCGPCHRECTPSGHSPEGAWRQERGGQDRTAHPRRNSCLTSKWQIPGVPEKLFWLERELPICWLMPETLTSFLFKPLLKYKYPWKWKHFKFLSGILGVKD